MKKKKIGKVCLNYTYYNGKDVYSDGDIEDVLLESCINGTQEELLKSSREWEVLYHFSPIRENVIEWYPISKEDNVLEIGSGCGAITGTLSKRANHITCIELSEKRSLINANRHKNMDNIEIILGNFQEIEPHLEKYEIITLIGVWEYSKLYIDSEKPFEDMLKLAQRHLSHNGKLVIAIENKMGIKYWNGAPEDHTSRQYSGLNDYVDDKERGVRTFSRQEIEKILKTTGFNEYCFYYPMPDYKLPTAIYTDFYQPKICELRNFRKDYAYSRMYNFNDAIISDQICSDGMFSYFANSFIVVCGETDEKMQFIKYNRERKKEFQIATEIKKNNSHIEVIKRALYKEGQEHIKKIKVNSQKWNSTINNIKTLEGTLKQGNYIESYIQGTDFNNILYEDRHDFKKFINIINDIVMVYWEETEKPIKFVETEEFAKIFGKYEGKKTDSFLITNIDMIFSNMKLSAQKDIYTFDNEWVFDFPIPYKYSLWRMLEEIYEKFLPYLRGKIGREEFIENFGIDKTEIISYREMEKNFANYVFGKNQEMKYMRNYEKTVFMQETKIW